MASLDKLPDELLSEIASYLGYRFCWKYDEAYQQVSGEADITHDPRFGKLVTKLVFAKARHPFFDSALPPHPNGRPRKHEHAGYGVIELPRHGADGVYPNDGLKVKPRVRAGLQQCFASILERTPRLQDLEIQYNFMASFWVDSPSRQEQVDQQARDEESRARRALGAAELDGDHDHHSDHDQDDWLVDNEDYDDHSSDDSDHIDTYIYADQLLYLVARAAQYQHVYISSLNANIWNSRPIRARTFVELAPALQRLQHLDVNFQVSNLLKLYRQDGSKLPDHDNGQPVAKSLGSALSALRNLKSIHLEFDEGEDGEDYYNTNIAKSLYELGYRRCEHLTKISFRGARFEGEELYGFLSKQKAGIEKLSLHDVCLHSIGHWQQVLRLMLEAMPSLKELWCMRLRIPGPPDLVLGLPEQIWAIKYPASREEALNELERLLKDCEDYGEKHNLS
ncbi:hypothetical protein E8E13_005283 [Curvularia kusanoi]|uniref:Uncharacterized protein n=1 Tax=Curvularia kusanoi TaxID=90978 RepID=A0A9P4TAS3_CURKU|nr:hypothetical protein E8E13_005283 [Curvularia kusanoi]